MVSKRKLLDHYRKNLNARNLRPHHFVDVQQEQWELEEIADPELRMLLVICHSQLKKEEQLAFMLKLISGFGIREVANALLVSQEAVKKRLGRAQKFVQTEQLKFEWPDANQIDRRRQMVHTVLYLLFNDGF